MKKTFDKIGKSIDDKLFGLTNKQISVYESLTIAMLILIIAILLFFLN
jgi:hypothetical protein